MMQRRANDYPLRYKQAQDARIARGLAVLPLGRPAQQLLSNLKQKEADRAIQARTIR